MKKQKPIHQLQTKLVIKLSFQNCFGISPIKLNMKNTKYIIIGVFAFATQLTFSQVKDENIGSEVVNIVKPYTPTISDAFKVKETPIIEDEDNTQKEVIEYNIFSFPVASTFTPAKGKAADVDKAEKVKLYNNYATLGFGNYPTINAELFITENLNRNSYIGGMLRHLSSQGGIKDVVLDDKYYNTSLDITYGVRERDMNWNIDLGVKNQIYNWYGLPVENNFFTITFSYHHQACKIDFRIIMYRLLYVFVSFISFFRKQNLIDFSFILICNSEMKNTFRV